MPADSLNHLPQQAGQRSGLLVGRLCEAAVRAASDTDALQMTTPRQPFTQDLKIASICPAYDATLLTHNAADSKPVQGLHVENWLD